MKRKIIFMLTIGIYGILSACGSSNPTTIIVPSSTPSAIIITATSTPTIASVTPSVTSTPDPCNTSNLPNTIKPTNELTRQFDDYATLARNTPQSELVQVIPPLQAIRRASEDQVLPNCLKQLKSYQVSYMDAFIQTMLAFESNASPDVLKAGLAQADQFHNQYAMEMAKLLGVTVAPSATSLLGTANPSITGTLTATPSPITVTNPTTGSINLHSSPSVNSSVIGKLDVGVTATAIGKSADGNWLLIEIPNQSGKTAWLYLPLVSFSNGDINSLPVLTPTP